MNTTGSRVCLIKSKEIKPDQMLGIVELMSLMLQMPGTNMYMLLNMKLLIMRTRVVFVLYMFMSKYMFTCLEGKCDILENHI